MTDPKSKAQELIEKFRDQIIIHDKRLFFPAEPLKNQAKQCAIILLR